MLLRSGSVGALGTKIGMRTRSPETEYSISVVVDPPDGAGMVNAIAPSSLDRIGCAGRSRCTLWPAIRINKNRTESERALEMWYTARTVAASPVRSISIVALSSCPAAASNMPLANAITGCVERASQRRIARRRYDSRCAVCPLGGTAVAPECGSCSSSASPHR